MIGVAKGETLPEFQVPPVGSERVRLYAAASLDRNPIHQDAAAAKAVGLDGPVVHGMLLMGQFEAMLARWRPNLRVASLDAKFLRPLAVGEGATISGRVLRADETEVVVRLTVRMQAGIACLGDARLVPA